MVFILRKKLTYLESIVNGIIRDANPNPFWRLLVTLIFKRYLGKEVL
jgi:hypothetical protein